MRFISVDIECNQPSGQIIQLGAVAFDTDKGGDGVLGDFNRFVDITEPVNWGYVLRSDGTTLDDLLPYGSVRYNKDKEDPTLVYKSFWKWVDEMQCGKKVVQWGSGDMDRIMQESHIHPKGLRVFDAKCFYQFVYQPAMKRPKGFGLEAAVKNNGLSFHGEAHNALYDAYNTGRLMCKMFKRIEKFGAVEEILGG